MESVSATVQSMTNLFADFFFAWALPPLATAAFGCSAEHDTHTITFCACCSTPTVHGPPDARATTVPTSGGTPMRR